MNFAIIEVGSTTTKAYSYDGQTVEDLGRKYIPFKSHYKEENKLKEEDVKALYSFIEDIKSKVSSIYVFGTSIFRNLTDTQREEFLKITKKRLGIDFKIVSAEEESAYTVRGVISNISYDGRMAVIIGGGGSTEIAIVNHREVVKKLNLPFGAMDVTEQYPELKSDVVTTSFDEILNYVDNLVGNLEDDVEVAVLAGGDYIYFYETVGYAMEKNTLYEDDNQPYVLTFEQADEYDHDIMTKSLEKIKNLCPDNKGWWDGARGMRFCMNAISRKVNAKYIVPTRINMLLGLVDEIKKSM